MSNYQDHQSEKTYPLVHFSNTQSREQEEKARNVIASFLSRNKGFKANQMDKNLKLTDTYGPLLDKMHKMLLEEHSREQCLLVIVQHKCLSKDQESPSEAQAETMLKEPLIRQFAFSEFARIHTALGF